MPASEAQIIANRKNAEKSTGPKTAEGKERSRANAYKHGLTGSGTVMPEREAAEIGRRTVAFSNELNVSGEIAESLVRRAATLSVRMERCVEIENARLIDRVRQAEADFTPPEGCDLETAARLRVEAGKLAMFDASREATLARQYENAAERGFYKALKELRQIEKSRVAAEKAQIEEMTRELMGSISEMNDLDAEFDALYPEDLAPIPRTPRNEYKTSGKNPIDVPITIGRRP